METRTLHFDALSAKASSLQKRQDLLVLVLALQQRITTDSPTIS
jgi:hypothetical protein